MSSPGTLGPVIAPNLPPETHGAAPQPPNTPVIGPGTPVAAPEPKPPITAEDPVPTVAAQPPVTGGNDGGGQPPVTGGNDGGGHPPVTGGNNGGGQPPVTGGNNGGGQPPVTGGNDGGGHPPVTGGNDGHGQPPVTGGNDGHGQPPVTGGNNGGGQPPVTGGNNGGGQPPVTGGNNGGGQPPVTGGNDGGGHPPVTGGNDGNGQPPVTDGNGQPPVTGGNDGNGQPPVTGGNDGNGQPSVIETGPIPAPGPTQGPVVVVPSPSQGPGASNIVPGPSQAPHLSNIVAGPSQGPAPTTATLPSAGGTVGPTAAASLAPDPTLGSNTLSPTPPPESSDVQASLLPTITGVPSSHPVTTVGMSDSVHSPVTSGSLVDQSSSSSLRVGSSLEQTSDFTGIASLFVETTLQSALTSEWSSAVIVTNNGQRSTSYANHTTVFPSGAVVTISSNSHLANTENSSSDSGRTGKIIGGVVGGVLALLIFPTLLLFLLRRRKRRRIERNNTHKSFASPPDPNYPAYSDSDHPAQQTQQLLTPLRYTGQSPISNPFDPYDDEPTHRPTLSAEQATPLLRSTSENPHDVPSSSMHEVGNVDSSGVTAKFEAAAIGPWTQFPNLAPTDWNSASGSSIIANYDPTTPTASDFNMSPASPEVDTSPRRRYILHRISELGESVKGGITGGVGYTSLPLTSPTYQEPSPTRESLKTELSSATSQKSLVVVHSANKKSTTTIPFVYSTHPTPWDAFEKTGGLSASTTIKLSSRNAKYRSGGHLVEGADLSAVGAKLKAKPPTTQLSQSSSTSSGSFYSDGAKTDYGGGGLKPHKYIRIGGSDEFHEPWADDVISLSQRSLSVQ